MKNLLTLFLVLLTVLSFAQQQSINSIPGLHQCTVAPGSLLPADIRNRWTSVQRSSESCDTTDILDYNTVNEFYADQLGLTYNGSWNASTPQPVAFEITSTFINLVSAATFDYTFAETVYDTLAFANLTNLDEYTKTLRSSTITIDSLVVFMGISGDTIPEDTTMANDSLVIGFYPVNAGVVSNTLAGELSFVGYSGLEQFFVGPDILKGNVLPVGITLNQGQGFAVKFQYYRTDTSSHCLLSLSFADSCPQELAYPSPFAATARLSGVVGNNFTAQIDSTSATTVGVFPISNAQDQTAFGYAKNCSYWYTQNWEFWAFVTIQSSLGVSIADSVYTIPCSGGTSPQQLTASATGDLGGATYTWSNNVFGSQTGATSTFYNPGTYSVTVTNSSGCTASAVENAAFSNGLNLNPPTFGYPHHICVNEPVTFTNTTANTSGYHWDFGTLSIPASGLVNPTVTYDSTGSFVVSLTLDTSGCVFGSSETITVRNCTGIQNTQAFEANVNIIPNPSNGNINVLISDADKNVTITVYNLIGQTVKSFATTESPAVFNKNFDLSNLANGTYLVKIQSGSNFATKKLVITK